MTIHTTSERTADVRLALRLTYLTLAWMTLEGAAALWLGAKSHSLLLEGFGADSVIELFSAGVLLWRLQVEAAGKSSAMRVPSTPPFLTTAMSVVPPPTSIKIPLKFPPSS